MIVCRQHGFTLIEVVLVIVITGILLTVALGTGKKITDTARTEETLAEMDRLAAAIVGEPESYSNGTRSKFGYVGDVGALPSSLNALVTNPGYTTWNGPYTGNQFEQVSTDYQKDAWQVDYTYSGGISITSTGSGESITRQFASSTASLLYNRLVGNLYDTDGDPPGPYFKDSVEATLSYPDGSGSVSAVTVYPDQSGFFMIDSIPIGNHNLTLVYLPTNDTIRRFVTVLPNSQVYEECRMPFTTWVGAGGGLEYVSGSAVVAGSGPHCDAIEFDVSNTGTAPVQLNSILLSWLSPVCYYKRAMFGSAQIFNNQTPRNGSGDMIIFPTQVINPGQTVTFAFELFADDPTGPGNSKTNMSGNDFSVVLSDGTSFTFSTGACP